MTDHTRRTFLASAAAAIAAPHITLPVAELERWSRRELTSDGAADDERYWAAVRKAYDLPRGIINLDHGNINPAAREVIDTTVRHLRHIEVFPPPRNTELYEQVTRPTVVSGLAAMLGVPAAEVALVRNATEALDTVLLGFPLRAGDEVVCSRHDYYAMLDALEQRRDRDGIVLRIIDPPVPAPSPDAVAALYEAAFTPRTRLVLVTHPSNLTGQLLPVRRIADAAHRIGAEVVLDGAQSFALLPYTMAETGCDYYGASLHKWLGAPIGSGLLWMRPEHMAKVYPLVPPPSTITGMSRYSWSGTYPEAISASAAPAIALQNRIGTARKAARMRYLTSYWRSRVEALRGVRFYAAATPDATCGIATFEVAGMKAEAMTTELWDRDRILVQNMEWGTHAPGIRGIRVTPNVYTSLGELDRLVSAMSRIIRGANG